MLLCFLIEEFMLGITGELLNYLFIYILTSS